MLETGKGQAGIGVGSVAGKLRRGGELATKYKKREGERAGSFF
jgi:hypothetical protein